MIVETLSLGALETNAYLVWGEGSPDCWIFDCPDSPQDLMASVQRRGLVPRGLFLTHAHADHIAGLTDFRQAYPGVKVFQHALEVSWLADPQLNLSCWIPPAVTVQPAEGLVGDGQILNLGTATVEVLHVPGHSPGSVAYWLRDEGEVIVGDVLFRSGVGRWDFPGSEQQALRRSLDRLCQLPDATRVHPGHGGATTIGREKASNPYLRSGEAWGY